MKPGIFNFFYYKMKFNIRTFINSISFILSSLILVIFLGCSKSKTIEKKVQIEKEVRTESNHEIAVAPPPFSEGIFPCSECHAEMEVNTERRELWMHEEITGIFDHDEENRWCLDCHNANDRDYLKLANGKLVDFKESYKLCGQCHGNKLRDWKVGVHGKRTGEWNGKKQYLLCPSCHNPHSPKFKQIKPEPPPVRQEDIGI